MYTSAISFAMLKSKKTIYLFLLAALFLTVSSCKKSKETDTFTFQGAWTVYYDYTTGTKVKGSFKAVFKSNGKWDYTEGSFSQTDAGTWTSTGNLITFKFGISGLAEYTGTKTGNNSITGTQIADNNTSTGTFTATR
jgi:hypothetical protein